MSSDIRKCEVCGKSYEEARKSLNEVLRSNIILPKIQSEDYRESLQKLLAEVKNFKEVIKKEGLPDRPLIDLIYRYGHYFDNNSTLYKFMSADPENYVGTNEFSWFEKYVRQVCGIDIGIHATEALQGMQKWLETEIKENVGEPGGFSQSVDEAIEEAINKHSMHTKTVFFDIEREDKLDPLLPEWPGSHLVNEPTGYGGLKIEKTINICWICPSLFNEASKRAYKVD